MHNYYNNEVDSLVKTVGKWNFMNESVNEMYVTFKMCGVEGGQCCESWT